MRGRVARCASDTDRSTNAELAGPVAVVVLAAGASRRLGQPKQLLRYRDTTLLGHAVRVAGASSLGPVTVVLGADAGRVAGALEGSDAERLVFDGWAGGMGSTIAAAVARIAGAGAEAVLLMTCDQPHVDAAHLRALAAARSARRPIAASRYADVLGIPAIFPRECFAELQLLSGDRGARPVIERHRSWVSEVACPGGALDVDTAADVERLVPPTLTTERLVLRPFAPGDAAALERWCSDRRLAEMTLALPHPYDRSAAESFIGRRAEEFEHGHGLTLAVTERGDDVVVGAIGLQIDEAHQHGELGYWIAVPYWGKGYAAEACRAMLAWGFGQRALHRVFAQVFPRNHASRRVLEKLGMRHEGCRRQHFRRLGRFEDADTFGMLREEWELGPAAAG